MFAITAPLQDRGSIATIISMLLSEKRTHLPLCALRHVDAVNKPRIVRRMIIIIFLPMYRRCIRTKRSEADVAWIITHANFTRAEYAFVSFKQRRLHVNIERTMTMFMQRCRKLREADDMQKLCNRGNVRRAIDLAMNTLLRRTEPCVCVAKTIYRRWRDRMKSTHDGGVLPHVVAIAPPVLAGRFISRIRETRGAAKSTRNDNWKSDSRIYSAANAVTARKTSRVCSSRARIMH